MRKSIYAAGNLEVLEAGASGGLLFMIGDETQDLSTVGLDEQSVNELQMALWTWIVKKQHAAQTKAKKKGKKHGS